MNEPDFEQFALVWREEAPVEEARVFRRLAQRASRKGRLLLYADLTLGGFIIVAGFGAMVIYRAPWTMAVALLVIGLVSWYSWRRYRLHRIDDLVSRTDGETMLASAAETVAARLRSSTVGIALMLPAWLATIMFKSMIELRGDFGAFLRLFAPSLMRPSGMAAVGAFIVIAIWFGRENVRLRRELKAIEELRRQYREESRVERCRGDEA